MPPSTLPSQRERMKEKIAGRFTAEHLDERERVVSAAIAAGKFPPSRRQHYEALYDASPDVAKQTIASLAALLPPTAASADPPPGPAYNESWLSFYELRNIEAAKRGEHLSNHLVKTERSNGATSVSGSSRQPIC